MGQACLSSHLHRGLQASCPPDDPECRCPGSPLCLLLWPISSFCLPIPTRCPVHICFGWLPPCLVTRFPAPLLPSLCSQAAKQITPQQLGSPLLAPGLCTPNKERQQIVPGLDTFPPQPTFSLCLESALEGDFLTQGPCFFRTNLLK